MTEIITSTGIHLNTEFGMTPGLQKHANSLGLELRVYYAVEFNSYLVVNKDGVPVRESQLAEEILTYLDFMKLSLEID